MSGEGGKEGEKEREGEEKKRVKYKESQGPGTSGRENERTDGRTARLKREGEERP